MKAKSKRKSESNGHPNDAQRLKNFRRFFGFTQLKVARFLEVPASSYRAYERASLPVPLKIRRAIGANSPIEILPMDPTQDPKLVYDTIRNAHLDEFCDELKGRLPKVANHEQQFDLHSSKRNEFQESSYIRNLVKTIRIYRKFLNAQRREYATLRRLYCDARDASFCASGLNAVFWITCLQLRIPLGEFTDAARNTGLANLAIFLLLLTAVYQDIFINLGKLPRQG